MRDHHYWLRLMRDHYYGSLLMTDHYYWLRLIRDHYYGSFFDNQYRLSCLKRWLLSLLHYLMINLVVYLLIIEGLASLWFRYFFRLLFLLLTCFLLTALIFELVVHRIYSSGKLGLFGDKVSASANHLKFFWTLSRCLWLGIVAISVRVIQAVIQIVFIVWSQAFLGALIYRTIDTVCHIRALVDKTETLYFLGWFTTISKTRKVDVVTLIVAYVHLHVAVMLFTDHKVLWGSLWSLIVWHGVAVGICSNHAFVNDLLLV